MEYSSPRAFLKANFTVKTNTKARLAGLEGQWLIALTTIAEGVLPVHVSEHIVLIELSGGMKRNPEIANRWNEVRQSTYQCFGAKILWRGRCDYHILGTAKPGIEDVLFTSFPNTITLEEAVLVSQVKEHLQNIQPYLTDTAFSMDLFQKLR